LRYCVVFRDYPLKACLIIETLSELGCEMTRQIPDYDTSVTYVFIASLALPWRPSLKGAALLTPPFMAEVGMRTLYRL